MIEVTRLASVFLYIVLIIAALGMIITTNETESIQLKEIDNLKQIIKLKDIEIKDLKKRIDMLEGKGVNLPHWPSGKLPLVPREEN